MVHLYKSMHKLFPGEKHTFNYTQILKTHLREACPNTNFGETEPWTKGFKNRPIMSSDKKTHQLKHQTSAQTVTVTSDLLPEFFLSRLTER